MDFGSRLAEFPQHQHHPTPNTLQSDPSYAHFYNAQNHPHHPQSYAPYAFYHPHNPPSNPNPLYDSSGPDTGLRPPGVDSYLPNPYAPHGGYVVAATAAAQYGQPQVAAAGYFHDPNAQQPNWGAVDPSGYAAVVIPPNGMEQMVGVDPNPVVWNNQRIHPLSRGIKMKRTLKKTKVVQSAWCEICKIDCNSQDILNKHKLGKRHMKNLKKLAESKKVVATQPVGITEPRQSTTVKKIPSGDGSNDKKMRRKQILASKPEEDIDTKRRKLVECGTAADSLRICTVCNVVCNSETVFNLHLAGQKHAAKVASALEIIGPMVNPSPNTNTNTNTNPIPVICNDQVSHPMLNGVTEKKKKKKKSMKSEVVQPFICELCKIYCSSQDILNTHNLGKRHQKNLEQFEKLKKAAAAAVTAAVNPEIAAGMNKTPLEAKAKTTIGDAKRKKLASAYKPGEDLETKKQKLLEGGTMADSVKACIVCNVVCNSETVYKYHLAGQKHATLLKKQMQMQTAATSTSASGPKPVSVATATSTVGPPLATAAIMAPTV
eukprot:TRINITY_DN4016_c0_g1_i1.p1 TRINITY_DN4016_c0_g1~~TRINITY_DN4016_c0_g1_i1.p1  ORF type:complete len:545 (+),score=111.58 TRINITY_DN4016_c0_g1_i1:269-1903(+)